MTKLRVITSPSGARFTVADEHADKFGGLVKDLEAAGYGINAQESGGYNPRNIRGSNKPSNHAFGRAIDINWNRNRMGTKGEMPPELARSIAAKYGMTWGGDWKNRPDPMHFEIAGVPNVPVSQRAFTRVAGVQQTQPPTKGAPTPMPSYKNVGGQTYMGPEAAQQSRRLAEMLINQGTNQEPMTHWTQALGKVLMTGSGALRNDMAMNDVREGQAAGNQALASMLMGGDASAAMTNPYSSGDALSFQVQQKMLADRTASAERLKKMELEAKNADPLRQLQMEKLRKEIAAPASPSGGPKLPTGYTWNDPANPNAGVKRLPGFEQTIPGEVAGKVAQMSDAKERIAKTRSIFEKDWSAGDAAKWAAGNLPIVGDVASLSGDIGIAQRDVRVGIEAALRTMTGAAAPEQEVQRYMQMYMPTPLDTKESAKQKLDGLISFMDKAEKIVMQGRGEVVEPALDATALQGRGTQPLLDKEGWVDVGGIKIREKR